MFIILFQSLSGVVGPSETTTGATSLTVLSFYEDVITGSVYPTAADAANEIPCKCSIAWHHVSTLLTFSQRHTDRLVLRFPSLPMPH